VWSLKNRWSIIHEVQKTDSSDKKRNETEKFDAPHRGKWFNSSAAANIWLWGACVGSFACDAVRAEILCGAGAVRDTHTHTQHRHRGILKL
jgi:Na+-transporting NADH:ubiquinone oxidoreductase subunit NqrF